MKRFIFTLIVVVSAISMNAQTIFDTWEQRNKKTNALECTVEIYEKDGKAYGKIIEFDQPDMVCTKCTGERKDKPVVGMDILSGLSKDDDEWSGGEILNPMNGKLYACYIKLVEPDKLKIKGHLRGISVVGVSVYWHRRK
jgi:uncharacterized protein (DUF2147 family)